MRLVLLGPPGAGKGTLAVSLKEKLNIAHISTGDILRDEIKNETPLGQEAKKYIENGELVPDTFVTRLIENRLSKGNNGLGFMLDGFPRTVHQAEDLDKILGKIKKPLDYALYLESTLPVIIERLSGRRVCRNCGRVFHVVNHPVNEKSPCCVLPDIYQRADDNEETIRKRMDVYMQSTKPIIDYYAQKGILFKLDSDKDTPELEDALLKRFNEDGKLH